MKSRLTTTDMQKLFKVSAVTLFHWRKGTPRKTGLPHHEEPHGTIFRIYYKWGEVKSWANLNKVPYTIPKSMKQENRK